MSDVDLELRQQAVVLNTNTIIPVLIEFRETETVLENDGPKPAHIVTTVDHSDCSSVRGESNCASAKRGLVASSEEEESDYQQSREVLLPSESSSQKPRLLPPTLQSVSEQFEHAQHFAIGDSTNLSTVHGDEEAKFEQVSKILGYEVRTTGLDSFIVIHQENMSLVKEDASSSCSSSTSVRSEKESTEQSKPSPPPSPPIYNPPRHPTSIFSFPTPTSYSAPPNPTFNLAPCAHGLASELFKCIVKKPDVVQLEINGEMQSNSSDVTIQFLAELRVYTTVTRHRNICAFLGSLENVGMVLEYIDGRTLYDVIVESEHTPLSKAKKIDYHNQLLDGLAHLHSFGLSHGDLSLLNIQVTHSSDTIKLLDFGRSVSANSRYTSPDDEPIDPFPTLATRKSLACPLPSAKTEQIHPGERPFCAPEILRGECQDALLADAYSFGVILVCLDRETSVDMRPWEQRKDMLPKDIFVGCELSEERAREYLKKWNAPRKRLAKEDMISS
ncbi:hypothetical protein V5O48_016481 [Marasmius crinis-equi]|uniref:Protein kinase domain-containing protein n=1 Tax=Marasmius crinis-equi TaxID=585013 RepID=A0ABR3ERR5_9AGAR